MYELQVQILANAK